MRFLVVCFSKTSDSAWAARRDWVFLCRLNAHDLWCLNLLSMPSCSPWIPVCWCAVSWLFSWCFSCSSEIIGIATILSPSFANCSGTLKWSKNFCISSVGREPKLSSVSPTTKNVPAQPVKQTTVKKTTTQQASTQSSVSRSTHTQTVQKSAANAAAQKQALLNYKIALRNKIASNINFGRIVGDGSCTISFKISSSGALTNRQFAKLSSNDSLNDAVYNGVMQTPAYNPPPSGYKNETLRLTVKMYGGNFEVDLN